MSTALQAGVDEVGRGPLAGPVVAAAVILPAQHELVGLTDSKKLSERQRLRLAAEIKQQALSWALGRAEVAEIDELNILQASLLAMQRAVLALSIVPEAVLVDGQHCPHLPTQYKTQAVIKGDSTVAAISAASIVAKVSRDVEMVALDTEFPGYGFAQHKGYPTVAHRKALQTLGVTPIHRRSYAPVRACLTESR